MIATFKILLITLLNYINSKSDFLDNIHVNTETQAFTDSYNRERYFHGTNVVFKTFPWYPDERNGNTFNETEMQYLSSLGMNVVRLGINWAGVMPTLGNINNSYIIEIGKIVTKLEKYGIFTILDSHQDIFSEEFCGNGFPRINNTKNFPLPIRMPFEYINGTPSSLDCSKSYWAKYYFSYAVASAFQDLYTNERNLTTYYSQFWEAVALHFRNYKSVIGYNLINEPFFGNVYKNPKLLIPEVANQQIFKFQDKITKGIRKFDDNKIIFFEGVTAAFLGTGFSNVPGGENYRNRSCISYHYYRPPNITPELTVLIHDQAAKFLKTGRMLTEFFSHSRRKDDREKLLGVVKAANSKLHSWTSWQFKCFFQKNQNSEECDSYNKDKNNTFDVDITDTYQVYPMVVAGRTTLFSFNPDNMEFRMEYETVRNVRNTTTIIFGGNYTTALIATSTCSLVVHKSHFYLYISHINCAVGSKITVSN